jgi:hypothetical protein
MNGNDGPLEIRECDEYDRHRDWGSRDEGKQEAVFTLDCCSVTLCWDFERSWLASFGGSRQECCHTD